MQDTLTNAANASAARAVARSAMKAAFEVPRANAGVQLARKQRESGGVLPRQHSLRV